MLGWPGLGWAGLVGWAGLGWAGLGCWAALGLAGLWAKPGWARLTWLALALGLDVSQSVDAVEYRLQLDGLANALEDAEVQSAIFAYAPVTVRLMVYEWGTPRASGS